jgi:hypothetical protein
MTIYMEHFTEQLRHPTGARASETAAVLGQPKWFLRRAPRRAGCEWDGRGAGTLRGAIDTPAKKSV